MPTVKLFQHCGMSRDVERIRIVEPKVVSLQFFAAHAELCLPQSLWQHQNKRDRDRNRDMATTERQCWNVGWVGTVWVEVLGGVLHICGP